MWCFLLFTLFVTVQGRAVNISNTWVLPEEGFPVFYRYFRDRISWYEADAVCQFHHANLVTVDTTAQYDAVRAYLKELDISSAVWVGLIRSNPDGDFTWTDYRGLSGDGYWSAAPDTRSAPLCAAADPAADYRWEARACGGPSVASFICELPVPQWALGNEGCMVRALPAVTVLYLPESAAVQLTADCGLAGVKRVQCTGNMKRDELLKELACTEEDQTSPSLNGTSPSTQWQITTDSILTNQDTNNEVSTDENITTEHEDDINQSTSLKVISTSYSILPDVSIRLSPKSLFTKTLYKIPLHKNVNLDIINTNNLQSNETPKQDHSDDFFTNEQSGKLDDEKLLQHTKLHDELARLGNLETIFSQPTDHFVPPLVMAKAKISDDMTALSIEEKLAQQLAERQFIKHNIQQSDVATTNNIKKELFSTDSYNSTQTTTLPSSNFITSLKENNNEQTGNIMHTMPKKYINKYDDAKHKTVKNYVPKSFNPPEVETTSISSKFNTNGYDMTSTIKTITDQAHSDNIYPTKSHLAEEATLELTVIIKDPPTNQSNYVNYVTTANSPQLVNTIINENSVKYNKKDLSSSSQNFSSSTTTNQFIKDVIDIQIFKDQNNHSDILLDASTPIPINKPSTKLNTESIYNDTLLKKPVTVFSFINRYNPTTITVDSTATSIHYMLHNFTTTDNIIQSTSDIISYSTGELDNNQNFNSTALNTSKVYNISENALSNDLIKESFDGIIDSDFDLERNNTDTSSEIDDFQSPLLSGASEPLHKPNRSRRLQQQNRNKFNPFRILG